MHIYLLTKILFHIKKIVECIISLKKRCNLIFQFKLIIIFMELRKNKDNIF